MKILIAGDFFISDKFKSSNLFTSSVVDIFEETDYRIVNLESPITCDAPNHRIMKTGPNLRMSEETAIKNLNSLSVNIVTLANNHILDYGSKGLMDTFEFLNKHKIAFMGAGKDLLEASNPFIIEKENIKVAILNFCETEWSIAEESTPGANPMDLIDNVRQIQSAKKIADYVLIIVHGGHEYYNLPSPKMQKRYRFYAEQGVDMIVGHHTHCINGYEIYHGVPIYYSLGNLLFTLNNDEDDWYTGLTLEVEVKKNGINHKLHPVRQHKENFNLSLLSGNDKEQVLERVEAISKIISSQENLEVNWENFVEKQSNSYINYWSPVSFIRNRYLSGVLRKLGINFFNKKGALLYLNLIRCQAHFDISKAIIKKYLSL